MRHDPGPPGLHVRKFGRGSQTMLLIHGFTDSSDTWSRVIPTLAKHYRVIAVDLPGFGHATRNWPQPLIPGYVELLRELICKQRRKQVTVVGNSLGAVVALGLATEHPHLVDRVVLADMPGIDGIPRWWSLIGARHTEALARLLALPVPPPLLQQAMGHGFLYLGLRHPHQVGHDELRKSFHTHYASKSRLLSLLPMARQLFTELPELPVRRMIRELPVPVLLLWGQHDLLTPSKKARSFVNGPSRRVVVIPDCGHLPQVDRPQEFLDMVLGFLEQEFALAG